MAQLQQSKSYNVWDYVKKQLCITYLEEDKKSDFEIKFKYMDDFSFTKDGKTVTIEGAGKVLNTLLRDGGIKTKKVIEEASLVNGKTKKTYLVKIEGFDPNAKAISKKGKEYSIYYYAMKDALYDIYSRDLA